MKTYLFTTWYENDKNREIKVQFKSLEHAIYAFNEAILYDIKCKVEEIIKTEHGTETRLISSYKF